MIGVIDYYYYDIKIGEVNGHHSPAIEPELPTWATGSATELQPPDNQ